MGKPFFTYEQQIQKLRDKNMVIDDEAIVEDGLRRYGYFALVSGYKDLLKNPTTKNYYDGTTFQDIVAVYQFDESLRELTLRYLLHIERHLRSSLSYAFCEHFGDSQAAYLSSSNFDTSTASKKSEVNRLITHHLSKLTSKPTNYPYIEHHKRAYKNVPLWCLVNALTFGTLSKFYEYSKPQVQSSLSKEYEVINEGQLKQILEVLTDFRNVCAHNERLFTHRCAKHDIPDLPLHKKLSLPKRGKEYIYGKRDYFSVVLSLRYLLPHKDFLSFKAQLSKLMDKLVMGNQQITMEQLLEMMGLPKNWKKISSFRKS